MLKDLYLYTPLSEEQLQNRLEGFSKKFDLLLEDSFSDDELNSYLALIDQLASVFPLKKSDEIQFEDFFVQSQHHKAQKFFYDHCCSYLSIENLPFLESNPFQVTYLMELLNEFEEVLIDKGGLQELVFKQEFLKELNMFKGFDSLFKDYVPKVTYKTHGVIHDPIELLLGQLYTQIELKAQYIEKDHLADSARVLLSLMLHERLNALELMQKSQMGVKEFGDTLERLRVILRASN